MLKLPDVLASGELDKLCDMGPNELVASIKLHCKRCWRIKIQGHRNGKDVMKGAKGHIQIGKVHIKVLHNIINLTRMNVVKESGIWGLDVKIIYAFIKGNMLSSLDSLSFHIKVQNILHSLGEAKEDTNVCIGESNIRAFGMQRKSINMAAKNAEVLKIRFLASLNLKGRCLVTMWCDIIQLEEVIEGIWPLFGRKAGTSKHSMDGIGNGLMGTFDWPFW
jgi:hypothetical protein